MNIYNADLLNNLLNTAKQAEIICIADEVMTGFGRTGKLFASEYMHTKPDIICLSKGLTGGTMALGVTACVNKIYDAFVDDDALKTFFHGHSFTANPLACSAALASLDLLEKEACQEKIKWLTTSNLHMTEALRDENLPIKDVRCLGTILAFEIDEGKKRIPEYNQLHYYTKSHEPRCVYPPAWEYSVYNAALLYNTG